ncbi:MAG: peptidylprolyl isomerase [Gemmatimonadaceae bacterium]|nr:peptidylprolyl isomerase [Gemmatimonadaceae bacterium]
MWLLVAFALQTTPPPVPTAYQVLAAEHARGGDPRSLAVLNAAVASGDTVLQRLAARAFGRIERADLVSGISGLLRSPAASVRREALNAFGQSGASFDFSALLTSERDATVRATLYETIGRSPAAKPGTPAVPPSAAVVRALTNGLRDTDAVARTGAARGFESLIRRTGRSSRPSPETVAALRVALRDNGGAEIRQLLLLALTAAGDRDSTTMALALRDTSAQVRRLAVAASRQWIDDPSPLVRYQALRVAGTCERASAALRDESQHVVLTAIDLLGEKKCPAPLIDSLMRNGADWRVRARALVAMTKVDTSRAQAGLARVAASREWQARAYAATAAKALKHSTALAQLARDTAPNVAIAALSTDDDARRALRSSHSGLVLAAAAHFKNSPTLGANTTPMVDALLRLSAQRVATNRDPRIALLQRLQEGADSAAAVRLMVLTRDIDPDVAALAAKVMTERAHLAATPATTRYLPAPFPSAATLNALRGATATLRFRNLGTVDIALLPDEAAVTVATFVQLAERGAFNGLTWHRIVPVFVLQGGSPGADEYDGLTPTFMRDEVGMARHARGTFGISTRGRDTGDGQIFINLVDNFRLDHDYTVFATMLKGFEVMDRVQEGDVIESVTIVRRR